MLRHTEPKEKEGICSYSGRGQRRPRYHNAIRLAWPKRRKDGMRRPKDINQSDRRHNEAWEIVMSLEDINIAAGIPYGAQTCDV